MIKDKLEKLLEHADMSKAEYARSNGVDKSTISQRFKRNNWSIQHLIKLADACNCDIAFIDKSTGETVSTIDISDYAIINRD